jgi:predicted small metal-binding protein
MSKIVRCREVGVDCDFEAREETEQEVLQKYIKETAARFEF